MRSNPVTSATKGTSQPNPKIQTETLPGWELDFSPAEEPNFKVGVSPGIFSTPALKRRLEVELFPGALKRSFPRINAGAPTRKNAPRVLPGRGWPSLRIRRSHENKPSGCPVLARF